MTKATQVAQAGLQGWRAKVADAVSEPVSRRTPLSQDQVRALVGAAFIVLTLLYVANTVRDLVRQVR